MTPSLRFLSVLSVLLSSTPAMATGHFPHERGTTGDWYWKDVEGFYSAHTNGAVPGSEGLNVFCTDPNTRGGVSFSVSVQGTQVGERRLNLRFDTGKSIDVIANYGKVTAKSATGQRIIASVLLEIRSAGQVQVTQAGSPPARFSLRGSSAALSRCP